MKARAQSSRETVIKVIIAQRSVGGNDVNAKRELNKASFDRAALVETALAVRHA